MAKKNSTTMSGAVEVSGLALFDINNAGEEETGRAPRATEAYVEKLRHQDIAFWGENNLFPQEVIADIEDSDLLDTVIHYKAQNLVSGGALYGPIVPGPGGVPMIEPISIAEIDDWMEGTNFPLYSMEAALDYYTFENANAELIKVNKKVTGIWSQDQSWVRLAENDLSGAIRKAYLSSTWETVSNVNDRRRVITFEAIDPYFQVAEQIQQSSRNRMLMPLRFQTKGRKYYALAPWNGFRVSNWFDVMKNVPKAKKALLDNMAVIRYQIEIDDRYWERAYPGFGRMSEADKEAKRKKTKTDFEAWIAGVKNNGKTLLTAKMAFPNMAEAISLWTINTLKFDLPTGAYIEDSTEADFHAIRSMGVQPSLMGISQSKNKNSAGSGSVNRVDRTNHLLGEQVIGDLLLSPVKAAWKVNGYAERYKKELGGRRLGIRFANQYATTLDRTQQVDGQPNQNKETDDGTVQDD